MRKLMLELIRKESRGFYAPALLARLKLLLRFGRASRGYVATAASVAVAAVVVVTLLTWLAPDSDKPIPVDVVDRILPGALGHVDEQVAALVKVSKEAVLQNVREGLVAVGSGISILYLCAPGLPARPDKVYQCRILPDCRPTGVDWVSAHNGYITS